MWVFDSLPLCRLWTSPTYSPLIMGFFYHQHIICEPLVRHPWEPCASPWSSIIGNTLLLGISPDCLCRSFRLALSSLGRTLNTSPLSLHTTLSFDTTCWADNKRYQMNYIRKVLEKFHMKYTNPISIPLANRFRLSNSLCPKDDKELNTF